MITFEGLCAYDEALSGWLQKFTSFNSSVQVGDVIRDNTGEGHYLEDMVFPTLRFPSDHALVAAV